MEYDITTVEKAKETLESIRKIWPNTKLAIWTNVKI